MSAARLDVVISGHGSVFLFDLITPEALAWVENRVSGDRQMFGSGLAVEHRYVATLAAGMRADGLMVGNQEGL